jgi:hypothetical protein
MLRREIRIRRGRNPAASIGAEEKSILTQLNPGGGLRGLRSTGQ